MRDVVFATNITADGYCDHTLFNPDNEVLAYFTRIMRDVDTLLYGRKTYELMVPYWPETAKNDSAHTKAEKEFAQAFVSVSKIVVCSTTLVRAEEKNVTIIRNNLVSNLDLSV